MPARDRSRFSIGLRSGILDGKHYRRIKEALWLFGYFVDRQTKENGLVLNGHVFTHQEIMDKFGITKATSRRWLARLKGENPDKHAYISTQRAQHGFRVCVLNQKKKDAYTHPGMETDPNVRRGPARA